MNTTPEIVDVLVRSNIAMAHPREWTYRETGEPLTPEDVELACRATAADLKASAALMREVATEAEIRSSIVNQLDAVVRPYFKKYAECGTIGDLIPHMTPEDREEFIGLARSLEAMGGPSAEGLS